jgi:hypothetical protein
MKQPVVLWCLPTQSFEPCVFLGGQAICSPVMQLASPQIARPKVLFECVARTGRARTAAILFKIEVSDQRVIMLQYILQYSP